jgi:hypothetical protein
MRKPGNLGEKGFIVQANNYNSRKMSQYNLGAIPLKGTILFLKNWHRLLPELWDWTLPKLCGLLMIGNPDATRGEVQDPAMVGCEIWDPSFIGAITKIFAPIPAYGKNRSRLFHGLFLSEAPPASDNVQGTLI